MKVFKSYDYDDLLIIPRTHAVSKINSREEIDLSIELSDFLKLDIPIIASPMKGISCPDLIIEISRLGGMGILPRFNGSESEWKAEIEKTAPSCENFGVAIELNGSESMYNHAINMGAKIICIDVANGYLESVTKKVTEIYNFIYDNGYKCLIMAGNVVTADGANSLSGSGTDLIRVGIGSGGLCTTRNVTGIGLPQLSAINLCNSVKQIDYFNYKEDKSVVTITDRVGRFIVSDGGIRNSGDAVKSLAVGADLIMIGSLFGSTYESSHAGKIKGMSSRGHQEEYYHTIKSVEGIEKVVSKNISLAELLDEFIWNMKSGFTYLGVKNIQELHDHMPEFAEVGNGSIKEI